MLIKTQYLVTLISLIVVSALGYGIWLSNRNYEYESLGLSIYIIFGFLIALVLGVIALAQKPYNSRKNSSLIAYNFIGTFNICISVFGAMFIYYDNGKKFSGQMTTFTVTFAIGLFILENIYFNRSGAE